MKNDKKGLFLKPVGKINKLKNENLILDKCDKSITRKINLFQTQEDPEQGLQKLRRKKDLFREAQYEKHHFNLIEDPRKSQFSHQVFLAIEKVILLVTTLTFILAIIETEIRLKLKSSNSQTSQIFFNVISLSTLILILLIFIRKVAVYQLNINQIKIPSYRKIRSKLTSLVQFLKQSDTKLQCLIEIILCISHPNNLTNSQVYSLSSTYDNSYTQIRVNDFLTILMLYRVYLIIRSLLNLSVFSFPRASRICQQNFVKHNYLFIFKCIFIEKPFKVIALTYLLFIMLFSYSLRIAEGVLSEQIASNNIHEFSTYLNCLWAVVVTMGTIGYGDVYPKTMMGRGVTFFASTTGILLSSLLIVSMSKFLEMRSNENKSHITIIRLVEQEQIKRQGKNALVEMIKMSQYFQDNCKKKNNLKEVFTKLKTKIDLVKLRGKKIKTMIDTNNDIEEVYRLLQITKDGLKDVYLNQCKMKQYLIKIKQEKIQQNGLIKASFQRQVQNMITSQ